MHTAYRNDNEWYGASLSLIGLWGTASRLEQGRKPNEGDVLNLKYLRDALVAEMRMHQALEGAYRGIVPGVTELPTWQRRYVDALTLAAERIVDAETTIETLVIDFGAIDETCADATAFSRLRKVARTAALISEQGATEATDF